MVFDLQEHKVPNELTKGQNKNLHSVIGLIFEGGEQNRPLLSNVSLGECISILFLFTESIPLVPTIFILNINGEAYVATILALGPEFKPSQR